MKLKNFSFLGLLGAALAAPVLWADAPVGSFDGVDSSVTYSHNVNGSGWAADYEMGAPVDHVDVQIDGTTVAQASLGGARPDVQSVNANNGNCWSPNDITYSGWSFSCSTTSLSPGSHNVTIIAWDNQGASSNLGTKSFTLNSDNAPTSSLSSSSTNITLGQSITLTSTITDSDGNLTNQAVDISTDNANWTSGWNNWSGQTAWGISGGSATDTVNYTPSSAGTYYFRSRGIDSANVLSDFAYVTVTVTAPNHPPQVNWASGTNTSPGSSTTLSGNVTDQDGNLQTAYFYINPPNRSGWQYVGAVGISGGNQTPSLGYTFPSNAAAGSWMVTMRVIDTNGAWDPDTNDIGYFNVDTTPTSQLSVSPTSGFTVGQSLTLTSTITDPDGNLSNQAVDISTDNSNWTSGWNNWSGTTAWSISGGSATNYVTYTPPSPGTYYFRSRGQDSMGALSDFVYITINVGSATYSLTVQSGSGSASGLTAGSVVSIAANAAPSGYAFSSWSVSGPGSVANASASSTTFTMGAGNATVSANYQVLPPTITSGSSASGAINVAFGGYQITATNNPTNFGASGLPPGLSVNTSTGYISGTPTQSGTFSVTISATNAGGTGSATLTFSIATANGNIPSNVRTLLNLNPNLNATTDTSNATQLKVQKP